MIVALCGNQNAGKTTLFNLLTGAAEHVGNYPGVTVEQRVGRLLPTYQQGANAVQIVDLPGVYSLTPYSREEAVTREYILREKPDIVIQVLDVTSLQRGLYLTLELMALGRPLVLALNMTEALTKSGGMLDVQRLQARLGMPCISINARTGRGARQLMAAAMQAAKAGKAPASPVPFPLESLPAAEHRKLAQARYGWIDRCLAVCLTLPRNLPRLPLMDWLFSNRLLAWPILAALVLAVLFIAFGSPGQTLTHLFEVLIEQAGLQIDALLARAGTAPLLRDLLINGAFAGVGAVVSFLPAILLLFLLIGLLEDSGLMARVAMALDAPMRRLGLSGRSFVPLMTGCGCTVPAVLAVRTLPNERDRRFTALLAPYIPCGAKAPVYLFFAARFLPQYGLLPVLALYLLGLAAAMLASWPLRRLLPGQPAPFLLELPSYRLPSLRGLSRVMRDKTRDFLSRAFSIVFLSSLALWALSAFTPRLTLADSVEGSLLYALANLFAWLFRPLGFGSPACVAALIAGLLAKENILSALSVTGAASAFTLPSALAFVTFSALYAPCAAACAVLRRELNSRGRMLLAVLSQTGAAWLAAFIIYRITLLVCR